VAGTSRVSTGDGDKSRALTTPILFSLALHR
jgi:hypothetical protein